VHGRGHFGLIPQLLETIESFQKGKERNQFLRKDLPVTVCRVERTGVEALWAATAI
jgi:hypothetical protein